MHVAALDVRICYVVHALACRLPTADGRLMFCRLQVMSVVCLAMYTAAGTLRQPCIGASAGFRSAAHKTYIPMIACVETDGSEERNSD